MGSGADFNTAGYTQTYKCWNPPNDNSLSQYTLSTQTKKKKKKKENDNQFGYIHLLSNTPHNEIISLTGAC